MLKFSRCLIAAAFAVGMTFVFSARAEVLVYEGFDATEYSLDATTVKNLTTSLMTPYASIGLVHSNWDGMDGTQPKVFGTDFGLDFPQAMKDVGFAARGGSVGLNPGTNSSQFRAQRHSLVTDVMKVFEGKLYLRVLLNIDSAAAGKLSANSQVSNSDGGYYGFGLSSVTSGIEHYLLSKGQSAMSFVIWRKGTSAENQLAISFVTTDTSSVLHQYELLSGVEVGETYICYVEIDVNAGTDDAEILRAGAQKCSAYNVIVPWIDVGEADILSDTSYPRTMAVAGPYGSNGGKFRADEFVVATTKDEVIFENNGTPEIAYAMTSWNEADKRFEVQIAMELNSATVSAIAKSSDDDASPVVSDTSEASPEQSGVVSFTGLAADKTYQVTAIAVNDKGKDSCEAGVLYNGGLTIVKDSDADEYSYAPATFTVSRVNADDLELPIEVSVTTEYSGAAEGKTWAEPASVVISSGATSATIEVPPILDSEITKDVAITVTVLTGTMRNSADALIRNLALPTDRNVWISPSNSVASLDCNWSAGRAPIATDAVCFDGRFSSANCEWDADAMSTVASWTQNNDYSGTITLDTVFPGKGAFTSLTVTGAMTIESGTLTHPQSRTMGDKQAATWDWIGDLKANETYRIRVACGSFNLGAAARVDVATKGYYASHDGARCNASHGGTTQKDAAVYGDPKEPIHIGMAHRVAGNYNNGKGGGAIYITVTGAAVVDGVISADSGNTGYGAGAAGSVYLKAASVTGAGSITAIGSATGEGNYKGTGGRIAIITDTPVNRATFAKISAETEWKNAQNGQASHFGGCGTVFFKDKDHVSGILVVAGKSDWPALSWSNRNRVTPVGTEGDWTFDAVELGRGGTLAVLPDTEIHLPGGLTSVSSTSDNAGCNGIKYEGGTLDLGSNANQTMSGKWMLFAPSNCVINANVTVQGGAMIGIPEYGNVTEEGSVLPEFLSCSVTVNGDLTIASDGLMKAEKCGFRKGANNTEKGLVGYHSHGGRTLAYGKTLRLHYQGYDSVFNPCLPGCTVPHTGGQGAGNAGGVLNCTVTGALTVDGTISANGSLGGRAVTHNDNAGPGGAVLLKVGTLSGSGVIQADGGYNGGNSSGGGGRVAVRLTKSGATFDDFTGRIVASGRYSQDAANASHSSSAGSVYLETSADGEKGGVIRIAQGLNYAQNALNTNTTEIVSLGYGGDDVADYKKVKVEVRDYGFAAVNTDVKVKSVTLATADAKLDLEGNTLTVDKFEYFANGAINNLAAGEYSFAQLSAIEGLNIVDTSAGQSGKIIVKERVLRGLKLILR